MNYEEPFSRSARWARRLGVFSIPVLLWAVLVQRSGKVDVAASLAGIGSAIAVAAAAIVLGLVALAVIWVRGYRGTGSAILGAICGALVLAVPLSYAARGWNLPPISDITTDPGSPPEIRRGALERRAGENAAGYPGDAAAIEQLSAYTDIAPLRVTVAPDEAHALALELVTARGWRVLDAGLDGPDARSRIEAVATTLVLNLPSVVVVRITPDGSGARVDMRAASRLGDRDFGVNARLIRDFLTELAAAAR
jgi:uncharacterized protein (DUF1499 family)